MSFVCLSALEVPEGEIFRFVDMAVLIAIHISLPGSKKS